MIPPRYFGERPLPAYTHVPGSTPHPVSDPRGHSFGVDEPQVQQTELGDWRTSATFLYAVDLFNAGFYWEAHEAWERLWIAAGRTGAAADFLKGLIKLAAAGVKGYEGNEAGLFRHLRRARELFQSTAAGESFGLSLSELIAATTMLLPASGGRKSPDNAAVSTPAPLAASPERSLNLVLWPGRRPSCALHSPALR